MTPARWQRVRAVLEAALEAHADRRRELIASSCGDDTELRETVVALLAVEEQQIGILDREPEARGTGLAAGALLERLKGQRAGPWEIGEPLGRGGMGVVFRGRRADGEFEQCVAVKVLGAMGPAAGIRFRRERDLLAALEHPHISRLLDAGVMADGAPYLVMELIDGLRIDDYCDTRAMPIDARLRLFIPVCNAVHFAHQRLIVHRDIKPANLLVTRDGQPKLLDFGIAKLIGDERAARNGATQSSASPLTPEYASPEQVRGERITIASDIYSLGVVLYELLCGHRPFEDTAQRGFELQHAICERDADAPSSAVTRLITRQRSDGTTVSITPDSVGRARGESWSRLRRRLNGDLDNIVLRAMHKDPARRYASVEQFADDISRYLAQQPVRARPDTLGYRAQKFVRRHRAAVAAAAIALVALTGGGIAATLGMWRAQAARQDADLAAQRARAESDKLDRTLHVIRQMLAAAHTDQVDGPDVRVRDVLDETAAAIGGELADDPAVEAAVRDALGGAYTGLGLWEDAERQLRTALELRAKSGTMSSADQVRTLAQAAQVALFRAQRERAAKFADEADALARAIAPPPSQATVTAARAKAMVLMAENKFGEAELWYRTALDGARRLRGDKSADAAELLTGVALALEHGRQYEDAESMLREALAVQTELRGQTHPATTLTMLQLARVRAAHGEREDAERILRDAVARQKEYWPGKHAGPAVALHHLGVFLAAGERYAEAEAPLREALALRRAYLHPRHRLLVKSLLALAGVLEHLDRTEEAAELRRAANAFPAGESRRADDGL